MIQFIFFLQVVISFAQDSDRVSRFPGWPVENQSPIYSGYLNVTDTRALHYILVEAEDSDEKPLLLWLNGGPGCSSMLGLIQELGPYVMNDNHSNFEQNNYTWLRDANLLFFESPAGVGFSINSDKNFTYSDNQTADDAYESLQLFFKRFQKYINRPFWVTGESYAGMYVPFLAAKIFQENQKNSNQQINLKGIMVGNGVLVQNETFMNENLVQVSKLLKTACVHDPQSASCAFAQNEAQKTIQLMNPYDIYGHCYGGASQLVSYKDRYPYTPFLSINYNIQNLDAPLHPPCIDDVNVNNFLNNATVQDILHLEHKLFGICDSDINQNYQKDPRGSLWAVELLRTNNISVLIYSGDTDSSVSTEDTLQSLKKLNLTQLYPSRPWFKSDNQLAGFVTQYDRLTFTTVKGAGHMVPQWQRESAYVMFNSFLNNKEFPN